MVDESAIIGIVAANVRRARKVLNLSQEEASFRSWSRSYLYFPGRAGKTEYDYRCSRAPCNRTAYDPRTPDYGRPPRGHRLVHLGFTSLGSILEASAPQVDRVLKNLAFSLRPFSWP